MRGGLKLAEKDWPDRLGPLARRLLDAFEGAAPPDVWEEGHGYAVRGQTRRFDVGAGRVDAGVQGRPYRAYETALVAEPLSHECWMNVVEQLTEQAIHGARILGGELPDEVESVFREAGGSLVPAGVVTGACNCVEARETGAGAALPIGSWCKHVCCAALLFVDRVNEQPFELLAFRGMSHEDLVERLRQRRELESGSGGGRASSAVRQYVPGSERPAAALEACVEDFWESGPELDRVSAPLRAPEVRHALLRRLGPSPFERGKFPLVGLLATCYEVISERALKQDEEAERLGEGEGEEPAA